MAQKLHTPVGANRGEKSGESPYAPTTEPLPSPIWTLFAVVAVGVAVGFVYRGALHVPFIFDDRECVLGNPSIRQLWPPFGNAENPGPLNPPKDFSTAGRPVVNWTFAVNYYFGQLDPAGYHLFNIALHGLSALLLWGIVRHTLRLEFFRDRFARIADPLALLVALLWAVHPLNTEAVMYVTQRTELLMGLFYLATLYASLRYWTASTERMRWAWCLAATVACFFGMGCKEVMASAPVMVVLFERTFLAGSFRQAWRSSWRLYLLLASSWLLLFALHHGGSRSESVGFHLGVAPYIWWATQTKVLLLYLKLCVWPWPLVIHYEIPHLDTVGAALPWVLPVIALMLLTVILVARRTAAGFVLTWMFAVLSPTLLVPIVTEIAVERRMYLPLAALVALAVGGGYLLARRVMTVAHSPASASLWATVAAGIALIITYSVVDLRRLKAYADTVTIWQDALAYYPASNVVNANLASELLVAGRPEEALTVSRRALAQGCDSRGIHNNLGASLTAIGDRYGYQPGQLDEAIAQLNEALRISPDFEDALVNLAFALLKAGKPEQAAAHCARALQLNPRNAQALYAQGTVLMALGKATEAAASLQRAVEQDPRSAAAHYGLALVLLNGSQPQAARDHLQEALRLDPTLPEVHYALGGVLAAQGDLRGAAREYTAAAELRPAYAQAVNNLGVMQMNLGETDNAIRSFAEAVRRQPDYKEAQGNLERAQQVKRQQDGEQQQ